MRSSLDCELGADMRSLGEFERAVLLVVLRLGATAYGVSIRSELESRLGREISIGSVYTTLERLLRKGMVAASHGEPSAERGGRAKKFYSVESRGVEALEYSRRSSEAVWAINPVARAW